MIFTLKRSIVLMVICFVVGPAGACGPGRGGGVRRGPRKLTPLVFKQHIPNMSENTLGASGLSEGKITRDDPRFRDLVPNYNTDIIFKDEEGTGADRLMTQRCKEKLNTLAISVMNQWPGVKVRVTEGWDEEGLHASNSLHYEGRAVDITTSDRDRSKYGMLARLAVEAGFDWVYYESRAHIHTSVKSESSSAARSGGCFTGDARVTLQDGSEIQMADMKVGDRVLALDSDGNAIFSDVILFLDRDVNDRRQFVKLTTEEGESITLTVGHLIFTIRSDDYEKVEKLVSTNDIDSSIEENEITELSDTNGDLFVTKEQYHSIVSATFAKNVEEGDFVLVRNKLGKLVLQRVTEVQYTVKTGVYAPLTKDGTILVNNIASSCYAIIDSQNIAHWAFLPMRWYNNFHEAYKHMLSYVRLKDNLSRTERPNVVTDVPNGIHWYARVLYSVANYIVPSHMVYN